jgi:hypothetical protein
MRSLLLSLVLILVQPLFAADDFFYHAPVFREGPNAGHVMDTTLKRAIRILTDDQFGGRFKAPEGFLAVANVFHNKKFYIAHIPKAGVDKIYFLNEPFSAVMSHSMLRFVFNADQPVKLIAEIPATAGETPALMESPLILKDLLVTPEVVAPLNGSQFNPRLGMQDYFTVVARVTSLTGRGVSPYLERNYLAQQKVLNYTSKEASDALMNGLEESDRRGMWTMYHTLKANCNVVAFFFLKKGRSFVCDSQNLRDRILGKFRMFMERNVPIVRWHPPFSSFILRWRGYMDRDAERLPLLNDDPAFLELAATYPKKVATCEENVVPVLVGALLEDKL